MSADINPKELRNQLIRYARKVRSLADLMPQGGFGTYEMAVQHNHVTQIRNQANAIDDAVAAIAKIEDLIK